MKDTRVTIIGVGLIGGSLGLALKKAKGCHVTGAGRHEGKLKTAKKLGAVDEYTTDFTAGVKEADIVVLCSPVDVIVPLFKKIRPHLKPGCVVTDAGSVKSAIVRGINDAAFVGAHPLAGSEKTGVSSAEAGLYRGATVVITPQKNTPKSSIKIVSDMWKKTGANVIFLSPEIHDRLVSFTSHLPHILAAALNRVVQGKNRSNRAVSKLLAGSFRDMTRITDSDPGSWAAICNANMLELNKAIDEYSEILKKVKIELNSPKKLHGFFSQSKAIRWQLLGSNQKKKSTPR